MTDYVQRGFYGASEIADAAKAVFETDERVLGMLPPSGFPARRVDTQGTDAMFAIVIASTTVVETPEGLREADPTIVGGLAGSTF